MQTTVLLYMYQRHISSCSLSFSYIISLAASDVEATQSSGSTVPGASQSVNGAVGPSDENASSAADKVIIPIAAMGTIAIVAVCATISLLILQAWRLAEKISTFTKMAIDCICTCIYCVHRIVIKH